MSLVILFTSEKGAIISSDKRVIDFYPGPRSKADKLERELYNGSIKTDSELEKRAEELGVNIQIRDNKKKIKSKEGVLIGEVTSFACGAFKRRRIYAIPGYYLMIEVINGKVERKGEGGSAFVILGNEITKKEANKTIKEEWNGKRKIKININEIEKVLKKTMENCSRKTASVSVEYDLIKSLKKIKKEDLMEIFNADAQENNWNWIL